MIRRPPRSTLFPYTTLFRSGNGNPLAVRQIAPAGYLTDLSDQPFARQIPESLADVILIDGKLWFLPTQLSMIGCIVNRRVWERFGLAQPTRWSEFLTACQKIKDGGVVPIALGNGTP